MTATAEHYRDKVTVVTGAASGIGLALAETMLSDGAKKVALADFNDENLKHEVRRLKTTYAPRGSGCIATSRRKKASRERSATPPSSAGHIDMLFNNAVAGLAGFIDKQTNEDWEKAFALNFYGALYCIRAVLPVMRKQGGGHIVDIISGIAFSPISQQTMYAATKAALNGLTLALRYELWDENIRVTSATPATTATAIWKGAAPPNAKSSEQSAKTILAGAARNERLVLGDQGDLSGTKKCFNPNLAAGIDDYVLNVARKRRSREWVV